MSLDWQSIIGWLASFVTLVTAIATTRIYFLKQRKTYFESDLMGNYKIFAQLKDVPNTTALFHIEVKSFNSNGEFFGAVKYSEMYKSSGAASGGMASIFGKIDYSFIRVIIGYTDTFNGRLFIMCRNDFDTTESNWRDMVVKEYRLTHYRNSNRLKCYDGLESKSYLQIPNKITFVNINKIPDPMLQAEIIF